MTLIRRRIRVQIILGTGDFGEGRGDTVTLEGYRVQADIVKGGLPSYDTASIRIYGLSLSLMNTITRVGVLYTATRDNRIIVEAGDDENGYSQVFNGVIQTSFGDFSGAPEAAVEVTAMASIVAKAKPVSALSYPNGADCAVVVAQIAASMGLEFNNYGVNIRLPKCYFPNTAMDQLAKVQQMTGINIDPSGGPSSMTVEIWPMGGSKGGLVPKISKDSDLVGYPQYSDLGISLTTLFTPGLTFGGQFNLATSIKPANGKWTVLKLSYELESETPGGAWYNHIVAIRDKSDGGSGIV